MSERRTMLFAIGDRVKVMDDHSDTMDDYTGQVGVITDVAASWYRDDDMPYCVKLDDEAEPYWFSEDELEALP